MKPGNCVALYEVVKRLDIDAETLLKSLYEKYSDRDNQDERGRIVEMISAIHAAQNSIGNALEVAEALTKS